MNRTATNLATLILTCGACGPQLPAVQIEMAEHYDAAATVYRATLRGDLDEARDSGRQLAEWEPVDLPAGSSSMADALRRAAGRVARASSLAGVAESAGPLAQRCVTCHRTYGVYARPRPLTPPQPSTGLGPHMSGHRWALDRLWEGLVLGADDMWAAGLERLGQPPADATEFQRLVGGLAARLEDRVHRLAAAGTTADSPAARAALFGSLLGARVECHLSVTR